MKYGNFSETWQWSKVNLFGPHKVKQQLRSPLRASPGPSSVHKIIRKCIFSSVKLHLKRANAKDPSWITVLHAKELQRLAGLSSLICLTGKELMEGAQQGRGCLILPSLLREEEEGMMSASEDLLCQLWTGEKPLGGPKMTSPRAAAPGPGPSISSLRGRPQRPSLEPALPLSTCMPPATGTESSGPFRPDSEGIVQK